MASSSVKVSLADAVARTTMTVHVDTRLTRRIRIGLWLVRLGARIAGFADVKAS